MTVNDYCTTSDVTAMLPDMEWGTSYDNLLETLITKASRTIDRYCKRAPGAFAATTDSTMYFDGSGTDRLWIGELAAAPTSVSVAETGDIDNAGGSGGTYTAWATSDYLLWPANALSEGRPYMRLDIDTLNGSKSTWYRYPKAVKIAGRFGYATTTPDEIAYATIVSVIRMFHRAQQSYKDAGAIAELGQIMYVRALDPDVAMLIDHLRRVTI